MIFTESQSRRDMLSVQRWAFSLLFSLVAQGSSTSVWQSSHLHFQTESSQRKSQDLHMCYAYVFSDGKMYPFESEIQFESLKLTLPLLQKRHYTQDVPSKAHVHVQVSLGMMRLAPVEWTWRLGAGLQAGKCQAAKLVSSPPSWNWFGVKFVLFSLLSMLIFLPDVEKFLFLSLNKGEYNLWGLYLNIWFKHLSILWTNKRIMLDPFGTKRYDVLEFLRIHKWDYDVTSLYDLLPNRHKALGVPLFS